MAPRGGTTGCLTSLKMRSFLWMVMLSLLLLISLLHPTLGRVPVDNGDNGTMTPEQRFFQLTENMESYFKSTAKDVTKKLLRSMMTLQQDSVVSNRCSQSLGKYIFALNKAKVWAAQMLDATSKIPPGILFGTFSDFGSFDECLSIEVKQKNGKVDFRGRSCSVLLKLPFPPLERKHSIAQSKRIDPEDTIGSQFRAQANVLHHKNLKFIVCVPSTCSKEDIQHIADQMLNGTDFSPKITRCYTKEEPKLEAIHIAVICCLAILLILGICGSVYETKKKNSGIKALSIKERLLTSFSLSSNFKRLLSKPGGSAELTCMHGMRALGICWIILGHSYVYTDFEILKDPITIQTWFGTWTFELINNGWLSVETFFLLSGILVAYSGLTGLTKTGGKINFPLLILRRYIRLTPSVLLLIGLVFFVPLISSGPFYYDHVGESLESCRKYWWTTILYFANWWGVDRSCLNTTWYLAADFQLHILSLFLLVLIYRYSKAGVGVLIMSIVISCVSVGVATWFWDLGPNIQLSTGDNAQVLETVNKIHVQTLTHLGPHCIGMIVGYYIFKYKEKKLSKTVVIVGWCASIVLSLSTVLGAHRFSAGKDLSEGPLAIFYAAVHRSVFIAGVAWVLLACITGYGGPVNALLSHSFWAPLSRLTFMIYLIHPLVIRVKSGSTREKPPTSHYEFVYQYLCHVLISIVLAVPMYLLVESPLANIDRLLTNRSKEDESNPPKESEEKSDVTLITVKLHPSELHPNHLIMNSEKSNS